MIRQLLMTAALGAVTTNTSAQPLSATATPSGDPNRVMLTQTVEPSFRIEPVVLRFSARRGEVVPFEFIINSLGKAMNVTVEPVNLRQEETGLILHDNESQPADDLKLLSPKSFALAAGDQQKITGELTIPLAKSNFLSYGILVREVGQAPDYQAAGDGETKAGIRFVTQYVLRVDVETGVADFAAMKQLELDRGALVDRQGLPTAQVYLKNPTDYAFECHVSAGLLGARKARPTPLGTQTRASLDGAEKYLVRIMPASTLRLESPFDSPPAGKQTLHFSVTGDRREAVGGDFAINVGAEDFPALASQRAIIGESVVISPAQWELGTIRGTARTLGVRIENLTDQPQQLTLEPKNFAGQTLLGVRVSPAQLSISPHGSKSVRVMLIGNGSQSMPSGVVEVTTNDADEPQRLPLAIRTKESASPTLTVGDVELVTNGGKPAFVVRLGNSADEYVPVNATLAGERVGGERFVLTAGYGVWMRPAMSQELWFKPEKPLTPGQYQLKLELQTTAGAPPIVREVEVTLAPNEPTAAADPKSEAEPAAIKAPKPIQKPKQSALAVVGTTAAQGPRSRRTKPVANSKQPAGQKE